MKVIQRNSLPEISPSKLLEIILMYSHGQCVYPDV